MSRRRFLIGAALALSLSALAGPAAAQTPRRGGTLTAIVQPEPVTLTSAINTAAPTGFISGNVFDGLVDYDLDLKPRPALAESWEVARTHSRSRSICAAA